MCHYYIYGNNMKKIVLIIAICTVNLQARYFCPPTGSPNESVEQAQARFESMTARQIDNVCMHELTANQLQGFKTLAQYYFHTQVATPGCDSQANRVKYEIMYQKIGELNAVRAL